MPACFLGWKLRGLRYCGLCLGFSRSIMTSCRCSSKKTRVLIFTAITIILHGCHRSGNGQGNVREFYSGSGKIGILKKRQGAPTAIMTMG